MNGIEKITARIETDAKAEVAEILREAEEKAAAIRAQYEAKAKEEAKAAAEAQEQLLAMPDEPYAHMLAQMAVKASRTGKEEILLNAKDRDRVGAQVVSKANSMKKGAKMTLSQETREMAGGLMLRDGNVEVNCAFETQLRVLREEMAAEVAGILFS